MLIWSDAPRLWEVWHGMTMENFRESGTPFSVYEWVFCQLHKQNSPHWSWAGSHSAGSLLHWCMAILESLKFLWKFGSMTRGAVTTVMTVMTMGRQAGPVVGWKQAGFSGCKCLKRSRVWNLLVSGCHANGYGVPLEKPVIWAFSISTTPNKTCHTFPYPTKWLVPSWRTIKAVPAFHTPIRSSSP